MTQDLHTYGPFALFAAFTFTGLIWVYLAFPECKGRSMETMDSLFTMPWYKVGRASTRTGDGLSAVTWAEEAVSCELSELKDASSSLHLERKPDGQA